MCPPTSGRACVCDKLPMRFNAAKRVLREPGHRRSTVVHASVLTGLPLRCLRSALGRGRPWSRRDPDGCLVADRNQSDPRLLSLKECPHSRESRACRAAIANSPVQQEPNRPRFGRPLHNGDLQQPAVRSMKWVGDFSRLESTTWSWWPKTSPVGTASLNG
jgi:hypothetical protein